MKNAQALPDRDAETGPSSKRLRVDDDAADSADIAVIPSGVKDAKLVSDEPLETLECITASWVALQPRIDALRDAAQQRQEYWDDMLQRVLKAAACSDAELVREREELATERYGSEASLFCTLPPSIAWLLPVSAHSEEELAFYEEVQAAASLLFNVRERLLPHINDAKARGDREALRMLGPKHAYYGKEIKSIQGLDARVGRRLTLASKRINAYRLNQALREVDPALLRDIDASFKGYMKVLDFYRNSDAQRYSFNRQLSGPQHFADIRRNVAVLEVWDDQAGCRIFNEFAVSGVNAPGVQPAEPDKALFVAQEVEDGCGETYSRDLDAEFKLCTAFCGGLPNPRPTSRLRAVLFSKKPLCASCRGVVFEQLPMRCPGLTLEVRVDEDGEAKVEVHKAQ